MTLAFDVRGCFVEPSDQGRKPSLSPPITGIMCGF